MILQSLWNHLCIKRHLDDITESMESNKKPKFDKAVVVYKPKYGGNVGSIARTCNQMGYRMIIFGESFSNKFKKEQRRIAQQNNLLVPDPKYITNISKLDIGEYGCWYALEIPENYKGETEVINIYECVPEKSHVIIIGSEDTGIPHEILDECDTILRIPSNSNVEFPSSINVSNAVAMAIGVINCKLHILHKK